MKILTKKKVDEILKRIIANEIISIETSMDIGKRTCMAENNAEIVYMVGGIKGINKVINTINRKYEKQV